MICGSWNAKWKIKRNILQNQNALIVLHDSASFALRSCSAFSFSSYLWHERAENVNIGYVDNAKREARITFAALAISSCRLAILATSCLAIWSCRWKIEQHFKVLTMSIAYSVSYYVVVMSRTHGSGAAFATFGFLLGRLRVKGRFKCEMGVQSRTTIYCYTSTQQGRCKQGFVEPVI